MGFGRAFRGDSIGEFSPSKIPRPGFLSRALVWRLAALGSSHFEVKILLLLYSFLQGKKAVTIKAYYFLPALVYFFFFLLGSFLKFGLRGGI